MNCSSRKHYPGGTILTQSFPSVQSNTILCHIFSFLRCFRLQLDQINHQWDVLCCSKVDNGEFGFWCQDVRIWRLSESHNNSLFEDRRMIRRINNMTFRKCPFEIRQKLRVNFSFQHLQCGQQAHFTRTIVSTVRAETTGLRASPYPHFNSSNFKMKGKQPSTHRLGVTTAAILAADVTSREELSRFRKHKQANADNQTKLRLQGR